MKRSQSAADASSNTSLRDAAALSVRNLAGCKARLLAAEDDGRDAADWAEWKEVANLLPPIAFEIAREVREFGGAVGAWADGDDGRNGGELGEAEDDFR